MAERAALQRRREHLRRLADASLRASTGRPGLHHRGGTLHDGSVPLPTPAMHLRPAADTDFTSVRAVSDAAALLLNRSDPSVHARLRPGDALAAAVFDLLEQLRVESLAPDGLPGVRGNLDARFDRWTEEFRGSDMAESALGLMIFAVAHAARSRILATGMPEDLENLFEHTRFGIAGRVGEHLRRLRRLRGDQRAFGRVALALAETVSTMVDEAIADGAEGGSRTRVPAEAFAFLGWDGTEDGGAAPVSPGESRVLRGAGGGYRVFRTEADRTTAAADLFRAPVLRKLRGQLDAAQRSARLDHRRLARRLERRVAVPTPDTWASDREEGVIDGGRLARLVASPASTHVFRTMEMRPRAHTALTLLLDCSGSMRHLRFPVAAAADVLARSCELLDLPVEVLGFTTRSWNGGRALKEWKRAGSPPGVGRVAERQHVVVKPFDTAHRGRRDSFAALLRGDLYREGLDGEALNWACTRARQQDAHRRVVVVVSDGSPSESATAAANDEEYLSAHLRQEVDRWSGEVEVAGLGLGLDLSLFYDRFHTVDVEQEGAAGVLDGLLTLLEPWRLRR